MDNSGPIICAKISISKEIPSSNWKTIDALKRPNVFGVNWILKGSSCPIVITNLSFIFTFCFSISFFDNSSSLNDLVFVFVFLFKVVFVVLFVFDFLFLEELNFFCKSYYS